MLGAASWPASSPSASVASLGSTTITAVAGVGSSGAGLTSVVRQAVAFAQRMRAHGDISFPDPNSYRLFGNASGTNPIEAGPGYRVADAACRRLQPRGGRPDQAQLQAMDHGLLPWSRCMQSHGVSNFPEPTISAHLLGYETSGLDMNSPKFLRTERTCARLLPGAVG